MKVNILYILTLILLFSFPEISNASEKENQHTDRWQKYAFDFGVYLSNVTSEVKFNPSNGSIGLDVDFEELLGLSSSSCTGKLSFLYRFSKSNRHAIHLSSFLLNRESSKILERNIEMGDHVFMEGTEAYSKFCVTISKVDYRYSLRQDDRLDLFISGGIYIMPMKIEVNESSGVIDDKTKSDFVAPLPVLGVGTNIYLTDKLILNQDFHFFYLQVNDYLGNILNATTSVEYNLTKNWGIGIGYNSIRLEINAEDNNFGLASGFDGDLGYAHAGLAFYAKYSF